jgi:hypothetical protein
MMLVCRKGYGWFRGNKQWSENGQKVLKNSTKLSRFWVFSKTAIQLAIFWDDIDRSKLGYLGKN